MKTFAAIAGLLISLIFISTWGGDHAAATSFTPTGYLVTIPNNATSANSNIKVDFTLDSPHAMAGAHVSFLPTDFGVANGTSIPNGAIVGSLKIAANESQSNGACSNQAFLDYTLYDASTATGTTIANTPAIPSASWPGFLDNNPANSLPDAVDKYPAFLNTLFPGLTPRSRAFGWINPNASPFPPVIVNRVVNVLVFDPGTALPGLSPLSASLGYMVVVVQQDPTATPAPSVINESCTPFTYTRQDLGITGDNPNTTTVNEGGVVYRTNPSDGSYTFLEYLRSRRDFDDDGRENSLDSCPFDATASWNPRSEDPVWDFDGDGIPGQDNPAISGDQLLAGTGCDPTPLTANSDPDGDSFVNRQDNCPLTANVSQADPDGDGIGDACDALDNLGDGHLHEVCATANVTIGSGGSPSPPACPDLISDQDNDGFTDSVEQYLGTNSGDSCGVNAWPADLWAGSIPNRVDIQDMGSFLAPVNYFNTDVDGVPAGDSRWDLVPGSVVGPHINLQDMGLLILHAPPMLQGATAFNGPVCPWP